MKKLIRLTEGDLHRIIENSVKRALNEVMYKGQSLHGNNESDWYAVANERNVQGPNYNPNAMNRDYSNGRTLPNSAWQQDYMDRENLENQQRAYREGNPSNLSQAWDRHNRSMQNLADVQGNGRRKFNAMHGV